MENLLSVAVIRAKAIACGFTKLTQNGNEVNIVPEKFILDIWQDLSDIPEFKLRAVLSAAEPYVAMRLPQKGDKFDTLNRLFEKYLEFSQNDGRQDT